MLFGGRVTAFGFGLSAHFLRLGRWRQEQLLAANERLLDERKQRRRAERAEQEALLSRARIQTRQLESEYRRQSELSATR